MPNYVRHYIERALREELVKRYGNVPVVDEIIALSYPNHVSKDTLLHALKLALEAQCPLIQSCPRY